MKPGTGMRISRLAFVALAALLRCGATPAPAPPAPTAAEPELTGREWRLAALAGEAIPAETGGRPIELRFGADGRVEGSAGCNRLSGAYTREAGALKFGPLAVTRMACPAMDLERRFLEALGATAGWKIAADALELSDASGNPLATFRGQP